MSERYGSLVFKLDDCITDLLQNDINPWGFPAPAEAPKREPWGKVIPQDPGIREWHNTMMARVRALQELLKDKLKTIMNPPKEPVVEEEEPAPKGGLTKGKSLARGKSPVDKQAPPPAAEEVVEADAEVLPPPAEIPPHFDAETLALVIALRIELDDAKLGVVFDDLTSHYAANQEVLFDALLHAFQFEKVDIVKPPPPEPSGEDTLPPEKAEKAEKPPPGGAKEVEAEKVWGGRKTLVVVKLALEQGDLLAREKHLKEVAEGTLAAASGAQTVEADSLLPAGEEPLPGGEPAPLPPTKPPPAGGEEGAVFVSAHTGALQLYTAWSEALLPRLLTQLPAALNNKVVLKVLDAKEPEKALTQAVGDSVVAKPLGWEHFIPDPCTYQIVRRPGFRPKLKPCANFQIFTVPDEIEEVEVEEVPVPVEPESTGKSFKKAPPPKKAEPPPPEPVVVEEVDPYKPDTRWVIPPHSEVKLMVRFKSEDIGRFQNLLAFEVVGQKSVSNVTVKGECAHPTISTDYRTIFTRKAKLRPPSASVNRQYIVSTSMFEFGPLLKGRLEKDILEGVYPQNMELFKITNSGLFDTTVTFKFLGAVAPREEESEEPPAHLPTIFRTVPEELTLVMGETKDLAVYAVPVEDQFSPNAGLVADTLVCTIQNNPNPVSFGLSAVGVTPQVQLDKEALEFTRLLVDHKESVTLTISNTCLLPVKWALVGIQELPAEFSISQTSGILDARSDQLIEVTFTGMQKAVYDVMVKLEIKDVDETPSLDVIQSIDLPLRAEAYKIEVDVKFPGEGSGLNFGLVRVVEDKLKTMTISNTGKYEVGFEFHIKTAAMRELFFITPQAGKIEALKDQEVEIHFNKERLLKQEVTLKGNNSISLAIIEPLNGKKETSTVITVDLRACFTKYTVTPGRGLNFGPQVYNTTSLPRSFEIANNGEFPFQVAIGPYGEEVEFAPPEPEDPKEAAAAAKAKAAAAGKPSKKGEVEPPGLTLGNFNVNPPLATVEPGQSMTVETTFTAQNSRTYVEMLGIHIQDRDPGDHPGGIPYEIAGESCIPGIQTEDFAAIFEEHQLVSALDSMHVENNVFAMRQKVFTFGAVIAQMGPSEEQSMEPQAGGEPEALGVKANFKMINPNKVPCTINITLKPRMPTELPAGEKFPMDIQPQQMTIPAHEHRYITCYFSPRAIQSYSATLDVVVENGSDPKTKQFTCDLRGEGTLPNITVEAPMLLTDAGSPWAQFPRVLLGKSHGMPLTLRNNGIIPSTVRLEMAASPVFQLSCGLSSTFTLDPKVSKTLQIDFKPLKTQEYKQELTLMVKNNQFETLKVHITGDCYMEDVTFNGLPNELDDALHFEDGPVGMVREVGFTLKNHTANNFRFWWPKVSEHLTFIPRRGHLHAHGTKQILVRFTPKAAVLYDPLPDMGLVLEQIKSYVGNEAGSEKAAVEWDDQMKITRMVALDWEPEEEEEEDPPRPSHVPTGKDAKKVDIKKPAEVKKPEARVGRASTAVSPVDDSPPEQKQVEVTAPEPEVEIAENSGKEVPLKVYAVADNNRYECSVQTATFRPTMMYQARTFNFQLKNTGTAKMDFDWSFRNADGSPLEAYQSTPYSVSPMAGVVAANQSTEITIRFAPVEVEDYVCQLVCNIPHLDSGYKALSILLKGKVLRPWCHFENPESDYVSAGRRNPELPGPGGSVMPLDPNTRVLEFESLGTKVRNTKHFFILNPTNISYEFIWEPEPQQIGELPRVSAFRCVSRRGVIMGGKRYEMLFEYTPETDEISEAFWRFRIPSQEISIPFLLVGNVLEPRVSLNCANVNFHKVLTGSRARETLYLYNNEQIPFQFAFDKSSYVSGEYTGKHAPLTFEPDSGILSANQQLAVTMTFCPPAEKEFNYNVTCVVKKKPTRLTLNVKGEGYAIHHSMQLENSFGKPIELSTMGVNNIEFGQVQVSEHGTRQVYLVNMGNVNYDYVWTTGNNAHVSVTPETGSVPKGSRVLCELLYSPKTSEILENYRIACQVVNASRYHFALSGQGHQPKVDFNFYSYDFGPCFLYKHGMVKQEAMLVVTNKDRMDISYELRFENTSWLEMDAPPTVLTPGDQAMIPIRFMPREMKAYAKTLQFEVNSVTIVDVNITGEGTKMRIELANPTQTHLNFGHARIGQEVSKTVKVVNRSSVAMHFSMQPSVTALKALGIVLVPDGDVSLRSMESFNIQLSFQSEHRLRSFTEEIVIDIAGIQHTLLTVSGACHGIELKLATDNLGFGPVVQGAKLQKHMVLSNTGDVGTKFTWAAADMLPHFSISPTQGFVSANMEAKFDIVFHPQVLNNDIRVDKVRCVIEGGTDQLLTLTGACVAVDDGSDPVRFATTVRESIAKVVQVHNPSKDNCTVVPNFNNDNWSGQDTLDLAGGGTADYTVTYSPKSMTKAEAPHLGSIFFPFPDGSAKLFKLEGSADAPKTAGAITHQATSKAAHIVPLKIENWLNTPQRFKVVIEPVNSYDQEATSIKGPEYIDAPAKSEREYKLHVYAYREGTSIVKVTFTNELTSEYLFYDVTFTAGPSESLDTIKLTCPVRQRMQHDLLITNPLSKNVTLKPSCDNKQVFLPEAFELKAKADTQIQFSFRPVLLEESEATLQLECPELGKFLYTLVLNSTQPGPERVLTFNVPLGSRDMQPFRFFHYLNDKAEYRCSFENKAQEQGFESEPSVVGHAAGIEGIELEVEVTFEPTRIGENFRDKLIVDSAEGGRYVCPVQGRCVPPKPQGPVVLKLGKGQVQFKNVFNEEAEFKYIVDNPAFTVKPGERIPAKRALAIDVSCDLAKAEQKTGKLIITCPAVSSVPWLYYLRVE